MHHFYTLTLCVLEKKSSFSDTQACRKGNNAFKSRFLYVLFALIIGLVFTSLPLSAQSRTVTGKITSVEDGSELPGVSVLVKGTTSGSTTNVNGQYSLTVNGNDAVLIFSFIGYTSQEITVGARSTIDVKLAPDVTSLGEVVVTGYTTQQKKDLTSAVAVVNSKDLLAVAATSVQQQLQGRAPGVFVTSSNVPGQGANVRIRGYGTIGNNDPLYIIDGVPTKDNLANFNQNDIESIQILKDATSASIYGARAGNGVVIITTKKGKSGKPRVTFDAYYGVQQHGKLLDLLNTAEYGQYLWNSKRNAGVVNATTGNPEHGQYGNGVDPVIPDYIVPSGAFEGDPRVDPSKYSRNRYLADGSNNPAFGRDVFQITRANKAGTNWLEEVLNRAPMQNYQLGVSGGNETAKYAFSAGYFNQKGMIIHNGFERYSVRANTDFSINKRIRIGENLQVLYARRTGLFGDQNESNEISFALRMQPIVPVYDIAGNFAGTLGNNLGNARNPVALLYRNKDNGYQDMRIFGNVYTEVDLLKGMTARTSFGLDGTVGRGKNARTPDWENSEASRYYEYTADFNYRSAWTWTNTLNYKVKVKEIHDINATIGTEAIRQYGENQNGFRSRYATTATLFPENLEFLDAGNPQFQTNSGSIRNDNTLFSMFGQINYSLMGKYLLSATLRRDASSRFLSASRWATFPAVSLGWRISEESFLKSISWITDLKIRGGWGQTGNQDGINDYNSFEYYDTDVTRGGYSVVGNPNGYDVTYSLRKFGNPQGKWETTTSTNLGFDLGLFNSRVEVTFDWYNRQTDDVLLQIDLPRALGNADIPFYNAAGVRNRGVDLGITLRDRIAEKVDVSLGLIYSSYRNTVTVIDPLNNDAFIPGISLRTPAVTRSQKGYPLSSFYGYVVDGIIQESTDETSGKVDGVAFPGYYDAVIYTDLNGDGVREPHKGIGRFKYRDINGDKQITAAGDQQYIGNPHPKFNYGVNLSLGYKGIELTAFLQGVSGNDIFNYIRYWTDFNTFQGNRSRRVLYDSWAPDNRNAKLPILNEKDAVSSRPSSYFIEKGSYARLKNLQLAYSFPNSLTSKAGLGTARVYVQAQNLFTITNYTGLDPEMQLRDNNNNQIGVDEAITPVSKVFLFGLSLGF
ncbi:SusC/RagA family TonB-linked outer membrane protein [Xanthocytophaga flava]|uniref:SusC/RagA family TonB-linked outer membrane protein n=1 Tax=Xanthocytophaga flava TaxID=3048013 RepID=UPI0028D815F4|nr:TonB-dependent receptor [Xanthocytophaga flavus]MDJ1469120.1 TonB-dependent receptor [Xanthocytophaga flavus]